MNISPFKLNLSCRVIGVIIIVHVIVVPLMLSGIFLLMNQNYEQAFHDKVVANTRLLASEMRFLRHEAQLLTLLNTENERQPIVFAEFQVKQKRYSFINEDKQIRVIESLSPEQRQNVLLIETPSLDLADGHQGDLTVGYDLKPIQYQQQLIIQDVIVYVLIYVLMAVLLAFYIRKTLVLPLSALKDSAHAVASGELQTELQVKSSLPEMLSLGNSLDHMRNALVEQAASLKKEALHDRLTGLPNRGAIQELIEREHARSDRKNDGYTLLMFDLDHFKQVNDNYGHNMGDEVLKVVAQLTGSVMRDADVVARWGGEEFLGLLPEMTGDGSILIADRLRRTIEQTKVTYQDRTLSVTVSMGLASFPDDGEDWHALLEVADARLYEAKRGGRNRVISGRDSVEGEASLAAQIETALQNEKVLTVFTPIVDLAQRKIIAEQVAPDVELDGGLHIGMDQFLMSASQLGLAHQIDAKVMHTALVRCISTISDNKAVTHLVKVSGDFLRHPEIYGELLAFAKKRCQMCSTGLNQVPLVIELEEQELTGDADAIRKTLSPFIDAGIQIALSGFGRGQNSMQYLADLPVSFLKITPEMVKRAQRDWRSMAILQGLQATSAKLKVKMVAEEVDDKEMLEFLVALGVDWGYGPLFKV